jgi:ankyrin repeat protein
MDVNAADKYSITPILYAAQYGHIQAVKLLLEHPNMDINAADK